MVAMKRKSVDGGSQSLNKRAAFEPPTLSDHPTEDLEDNLSGFSSSRRTSVSYDAQPILVDTPVTELSTTSRRSRKFPSDLKSIACPYTDCPKTFNRPARLAAHLRSHTNERPFKCPYECGKAYLEQKHLKQHIKGSHTQERKYVCAEPGCEASFTTGTRLRRHADVHTGAERFRCREHPPCNKTFRKHQTLERHIRTEHLGQAAYPCEIDSCEATFDTAGALKRHTQREHGEIRFWCDECNEDVDEEDHEVPTRHGFTTLDLLKAHVRLYHINCHFCDIRCGSQAELERHVERYHSGSTLEDRKTVACTWHGCQKKFVKQSNLKMHIRTAHEGFRFICGEVDLSKSDGLINWNEEEEGCGEGFISKLKLEEHVRFVHLGMKRPKPAAPIVESPMDYIGQIAGVSDATRQVACTFPGCGAGFLRYHDLSLHMDLVHNAQLAGDGMATELQDGASLGQTPGAISYPEPTLQSPAVPDQVCGDQAMNDEQFWVGANYSLKPQDNAFISEWEEMRKLIDFDG